MCFNFFGHLFHGARIRLSDLAVIRTKLLHIYHFDKKKKTHVSGFFSGQTPLKHFELLTSLKLLVIDLVTTHWHSLSNQNRLTKCFKKAPTLPHFIFKWCIKTWLDPRFRIHASINSLCQIVWGFSDECFKYMKILAKFEFSLLHFGQPL